MLRQQWYQSPKEIVQWLFLKPTWEIQNVKKPVIPWELPDIGGLIVDAASVWVTVVSVTGSTKLNAVVQHFQT